jgi:hypothetical protein
VAERKAIRDARKAAFLEAFAQTGVIRWAAATVPVDRHAVYDWCRDDPEFKVAFDAAEEDSADRLEQEAFRRSHDGVEKYVVSHGSVVHFDGKPLIERTYSDQLMMFLLKARRPERFRERQSVELSGKDGGPIEVDNVRERLLSRLTPKEAG